MLYIVIYEVTMINEIKDMYIILGHKLIPLLNNGDGTVSKDWIGI